MSAPMDREPEPEFNIRHARATDREALIDICLLSAAPDPTGLYSDAQLPAQIWALPYLALEPDLAFVLTRHGTPVGYCVGTADSQSFFDRQLADWLPDLQKAVAGRVPTTPAEENLFDLILNPAPPSAEFLDRFPAHLHINLLQDARGQAWGSRLLCTQLDALRRAKAPGVHIGMNPAFPRSARFYERHGFARHWSDHPFAMGLVLSA